MTEVPLFIRPAVPALDAVLGQVFPVLDHGFIRVLDYMGDDAAIAQAARVSTGGGVKTAAEDAVLIRDLRRQHHTSPFEMCEIKLHVKLPIFVARQWIRHRTASVNEISGRYSVLENEFYVPDAAALRPLQKHAPDLSPDQRQAVQQILRDEAERAYATYQVLLGKADPETQPVGVARELARMVLSLNTYTQWYWKIDLHNLFHFLRLRCDVHTQYEIRCYADVILELVQRWVPEAYAAFVEYDLSPVMLSATQRQVPGVPDV